MTSKVEAANRALSKVGDSRITALTDNTKQAREINACFDIVRDAELRDHRWSFAKKRAQLAASATAPLFGFSYSFPLPTDCLRVLRVGDISPGVDLANYRNSDSSEFAIEGRAILCNDAGPLNVIYTAQIEDTTQWDASFVEVFAARMAYEVCDALTASGSRKEALGAEYRERVAIATRANAIELPPQPIEDDSWVLARTLG